LSRNIKKLFIKPDCTIKKAMQVINEASKQKLPIGITLVINNNEQLIGTVTDGDIRKSLLEGKTINDSIKMIMAKDPITVGQGLNVNDMLSIMSKKINQSGRFTDKKVDSLIIVDKDNKVIDLVSYYDLLNNQVIKYKKVTIVGTGQVGLTLSVVLVDVGFEVKGFDINAQKIKRLNEGKIDFFEKGVESLLNIYLKEGNLNFTSSLDNDDSEIYIICVGTPVEDKTKEPILDDIEKAAYAIGKLLKKNNLVILRSTVTVGTTRNLVLPILENQSGLTAGEDFSVAFTPERVVEGNAIEEIKKIPQIIGGIDYKSIQEATKLFQEIGSPTISVDSLETAEIIKLINNTYRDYCFGFSNNLVELCEKLNLNANEVISAATDGYPRNPIPMPSPGVGGYCLTKDPYLLAHVARNNNINPNVYTIGRSVNEGMPIFIAKNLEKFVNKHFNSIDKIKIYIMGIAFKGYPETSDMRGSPSLDLINILKQKIKKDLIVSGYDDVVPKRLIESAGIKFEEYEDGFSNAHSVFIMNNHPNFSKIDIFPLLGKMNKPGFFFDGWNMFNRSEVMMINNIHYFTLGG
jgi:UDP-N-acetyl-D-mannosaminuronic acid dehydrogenase